MKSSKHKNILLHFTKREQGFFPNFSGEDFQIFRRLYEKEDFKFKLKWKPKHHGRINIFYDKVFLNFRDCYSLSHITLPNVPRLYTLREYLRGTRCEDKKMLAHKEKLLVTPLPREDFRPFILCLTDDNYMLRIDLENGSLLEKVYLGKSGRAKFISIGWHEYRKSVTVQSRSMRHMEDKNTLCYIAIFKVNPLRFDACFRLRTDLFGPISEAATSDDFLCTSTPLGEQNRRVDIYSLLEVLDSTKYTFRPELGKPCHDYDFCDECKTAHTRVVGKGNHGIPVNLYIDELPKLLFSAEINAPELEVGVSSSPHYIFSPVDRSGVYQVARFRDKSVVEGGEFDFTPYFDTFNKVYFHEDHSDRLVVVGNHQISFYKIRNHRLNYICSVSPKGRENEQQSISVPSTSSKSSRKKSEPLTQDFFFTKTLFAYTYDPDCNTFCLIGIDPESPQPRGAILAIFDNRTLDFIRKESLPFTIDDDEDDLDLSIDFDTLTVVQKHSHSYSDRLYCFRLTRDRD